MRQMDADIFIGDGFDQTLAWKTERGREREREKGDRQETEAALSSSSTVVLALPFSFQNQTGRAKNFKNVTPFKARETGGEQTSGLADTSFDFEWPTTPGPT